MQGKLQHYVFVSSAGAYAPNPIEPCHLEGDPRKASAGHVGVEKYLLEKAMPYTVFQPLYIYGPHAAKEYLVSGLLLLLLGCMGVPTQQ